MKADILWNFISPVTGRVLSTTDYVLVGDKAGIATPSPILIDIRLELINLRKELNQLRADYNLARSAQFIIGVANSQLTNAQILDTLPNGIMTNTSGTVGAIANISIDQLPNLTLDHIWVGNIFSRPSEIIYVPPPLLQDSKENKEEK